ncbi:MAG TPA: class I SAM-dependent methyltransferase [Bacteroidota bacterium]|nr:class I SAM-dependent methyltransferase [Bacteroidota bacterium]
MVELKSHWEKIFTKKKSTEVSWYKPRLEISLRLIKLAAVGNSAAIIDIGGGDSALVDDLLKSGYSNITVLDISQPALDRTRARLGEKSENISWLNADITQSELPSNSYDLWHDRAMFHFLIDATAREAYVRRCQIAVKPGGAVIIATFAADGPEQCSGLPTMRYSPEELQRHMGPSFRLIESIPEMHITPHGKPQSFVYCLFRKKSD